jgi:hypothetical protein
MSLLSIRKLTPTIGKTALMTQRVRAVADAYARNGARCRVASVVAGDGAGQVYLAVHFDDGKSMAQIWEKTQADPAFTKVMADRERDPAGSVEGPELYQTVFGQLDPGYTVVLMREYTIARDKLDGALGLMPDLGALMKAHDVQLVAVRPVFSGDMSRLIAGYYCRSPAHLGSAIDGVGSSAEFRSIVARAAAFGTLARSRVLVNI